MEPWCIAGGNNQWYNYCRKQLGNSSKSQRWNYCNDSAISLWGIYQRKRKQGLKQMFTHQRLNSNIHNSQKLETTIKRWVDKQNIAHNTMEYYWTFGILFDHKRNEIQTHATTWINLEIMLSKISQTKGQILISLT